MLFFRNNKQFSYLLFLIGAVIILDLLPVFHAVFTAKVPSENLSLALGQIYYGAGGGGYYPARLDEIIHGYPFFGNPYFFEHRNDFSPASFGADWVAAIPMFFGLSLNGTLIFNAFFWSIIFVLLAYFVLLKLNLSPFFSAAGALLAFSEGYFLIVRSPVSMQTIFPFLLLFYLAYLFSKPDSWKTNLALAASVAVSFYIYTFLWQAILATLVLAILFLLVNGDRQAVKRLCLVGAIAFILALPMAWYILQQMSGPFYQDMTDRFGIIATRLPTLLAFSSGIWIVSAVLLWFFSSQWLKNYQAGRQYEAVSSFFMITGLALLGVDFSNVLTGKDMELPVHIERFMMIWAPLSLTAFIYFLFKDKNVFKQLEFRRKVILGIFAIITISGLFYYWYHRKNFSFESAEVRESLIAIQKPAKWLEDNEKEPVVILTGPMDNAGADLPVFTRHYVLFSPNGSLHPVSSWEIEDRYLAAGYLFQPLTIQKLKEDFTASAYSGLGNAVHKHQTYNRRVKLCRLFQLARFGVSCGELQTAVSFRGEAYFENLYRRYTDEIAPRILKKFQEYHVSYIILNKSREDKEYFENRLLSSGIPARPVYEDENYLIYKI